VSVGGIQLSNLVVLTEEANIVVFGALWKGRFKGLIEGALKFKTGFVLCM